MTRVPVLLVLLLSALLTACSSGGDEPASGSQSASPSPSPSPSPVDVSVAGPPAAVKINLQAADLPSGFKSSPDPDAGSDEQDTTDRDVAACTGMPYVEPVVSEVSELFTKGDSLYLEYSSQVDIYADAAPVAADVAALQGDRLGGCLAKEFMEELSSDAEGVSFTPLVVTKLAPVVAGSDGVHGLRFSTTGEAQGRQFPFMFDILLFAKDRTEVFLTVGAFGVKSNDAERDALFAKLVERGKANAL